MSKMGLHDPFGYLKHKLWPKEWLRIKLSKIALVSLHVGDVRHTIGKLLTKDITLF
jgi:hypothetical protein